MRKSSLDEKPTDIDQYTAWLRNEFSIEGQAVLRNRFEFATSRILLDLQSSLMWRAILAELREWDDEYFIKTEYRLFSTSDPPELVRKGFESFYLKTFRRNILETERWPEEPEGGWITPSDWFSRINDVIRTIFVVKYLDGVTFLSEKMRGLCEKNEIPCRVDFEAREEGYYAAHLYMTQLVEIPKPDWDTERVPLSVEFQITTQLQDVIVRLTHEQYERRRVRIDPPSMKWQWDYESEEFIPNYLGHILHYLEGMIMEVRTHGRADGRAGGSGGVQT